MGTSLKVAVVGAGPAGSTAARLLAERGARVSLFEARRLPRPKLCGGGLTPKAQGLLPASALATVQRRIDSVVLEAPGGIHGRVRDADASVAMVERREFDHALIEAAARAGAIVRDAEPVSDVAADERGVTLATAGGKEAADLVLLADGEPSRLAPRVGLGSVAHTRALALEVDLPFRAGVDRDTAVVSYRVPAGYAWCFPKGDHVNVGLASARMGSVGPLRETLLRFADHLGLEPAGERISGHWIAAGLRRGALVRGRVLLLGDAAATADPFFGEGISYAVASALVAAETATAWAYGATPDLGVYDAAVRTMLRPGFARLAAAARLVDHWPTAAVLAVRYWPPVRRTVADVVIGRGPWALDRAIARARLAIWTSGPAGSGASDGRPTRVHLDARAGRF